MLPEDAMEEEERARRADRLALAQGQRDRMLDRVTQVRGGEARTTTATPIASFSIA